MTAEPVGIAPTALQDALWWIHQSARNKSVYNITWRLGCDGPVDEDALQAAWQAVVDRHEALRLSFDQQGGVPTATIAPRVPATAAVVEVGDPGSTSDEDLFRAIADEVHEQEFSLSEAPLARLALVRVGAATELVLTAHHIVLDGWAIRLLLADLSEAYDSARRGVPPSFACEAASWHEYVQEQHALRTGDHWRSSLAHWREKLDGAVATTVAGDRSRYAAAGSPGAALRHSFSAAAAAGLAELAKAASATSFAVVLGALQIVLARGGAGPDVTLGVVTGNRMSKRDQRLVGYLTNVCLSRSSVHEQDSVVDVVGRARDGLWEMLAHQSVSYPEVFAALPDATKASLGGTAPMMLNYLGSLNDDLRLGDIGLVLHPSPNRTARADIGIAYWENDGGIEAELEYNTVRYDRDTVLRLLHDLDTVLSNGTERRAVSDLPVRTRSTASNVDHRQGADQHRDAELDDTELTRRMSQAWAAVLGYPPEHLDEDFFESGGHSLNAVQFVAALNDETGAEVDLATWLAQPTPRRLLAQLTGDSGSAAASASTVVSLQPGSGRHLHLVPGAGGSAQDYRELVAALPRDWLVTLSQEREAHDSLPAMAARFRADLDDAGLRPDLVAGWSMGGQVAFELAAGYPTATPGVVLIDAPPPVGFAASENVVLQHLDEFVATVCLTLGTALDGTLPKVSTVDVPLLMAALAARLRAAGNDISARDLVDRWNTYHRHLISVAGYVSDRILTAPAVVIGADVSEGDLDEWVRRFDPAPEVRRVDADHFSVLRSPVTEDLAEVIERFC